MFRNLLFKYPVPGFGRRTQTRVETMQPADLARRLEEPNPPLVVDVRTPEEYAGDGHIAGSRLLPLSTLLQRRNELPPDRPIVFVCRSGSRSHVACEQLARLGFTNTINLAGGMLAWRQAGLPGR